MLLEKKMLTSASNLRRSQRILRSNSKVCSSPVPSLIKLNTPILTENPFLYKTPVTNSSKISTKLVESLDGAIFSENSINGSVDFARVTNGVEGFHGPRRSTRVSKMGNISGIIEEEGEGSDGYFGQIEETPKGNLGKRSSQSVGVMGIGKIDGRDEMGTESSGPMTLLLKKRAKKRSRGSRSEDKSNHLRSPLSSIQNISTDMLAKPNGRVNKSLKTVDGVQGSKRLNTIAGGSRKDKSGGADKENVQSMSTDLVGKVSMEVVQEGNAEGASLSKENGRKTKGGTGGRSVRRPLLKARESGEKKSRNTSKGVEQVGDKKVTNPSGVNCDIQEWTKDQELALQKAYFVARPSPHFWKKVSKMVPGKSAQECFDKIHADSITPPQPQPRSRAKKSTSSPLAHFSLSASKLLEPAEETKKPRSSRQKKSHAHKNVRHLLQKHSEANQGYAADVFSILEPGMNLTSESPPHTELPSTPPCLLKKNGFFEYQERSSSSHKKKPPLSRFRNSNQEALVSPPVLKPIRNKALHEKYIDQLHSREARRRAGDKRNLASKEEKAGGNVQKMDVVKAARNALVSDARDMIQQFQHIQANPTNSFEDEGTSAEDDDDEEE